MYMAIYTQCTLACICLCAHRSVLFTGQIERSFTHSSVLLGHSDRPVTIGINTQGLHIIRQSSPPVRRTVTCTVAIAIF